jgi:hypothetical protein
LPLPSPIHLRRQIQPAADPAQAAVPDPAAPELKGQSYKVKINGEEVDVALDELLKGYSRTGDYTRKAMDLAAQRKAFDDDRKQFDSIREQATKRETAITEFLRDKEQVKRYYEYLTGEQLTPAQQHSDRPILSAGYLRRADAATASDAG